MIHIDKKFKNQQNAQFFWWFLVPKIVFWKKHYWVATTTDCFEPIFGFLGQFCFEKHRSASWSRIGMFSELSGRSVISTWLNKHSNSILDYYFEMVWSKYMFDIMTPKLPLYFLSHSDTVWTIGLSEHSIDERCKMFSFMHSNI